ncbi:hypothetical protein OV079_47035 [Nannocystis pusilla]|uniref:Uncharacterized protein n=1 Tax=Nannocystis pusilla TaxID=889268 RepID=A0A9X3F1Q4_9BACT|nr:hypothetical protein [Nannocystis pusilla]MCY1012969.1 hypothetical protein [Nannocystis pusilla]
MSRLSSVCNASGDQRPPRKNAVATCGASGPWEISIAKKDASPAVRRWK